MSKSTYCPSCLDNYDCSSHPATYQQELCSSCAEEMAARFAEAASIDLRLAVGGLFEQTPLEDLVF